MKKQILELIYYQFNIKYYIWKNKFYDYGRWISRCIMYKQNEICPNKAIIACIDLNGSMKYINMLSKFYANKWNYYTWS